MALTPTLSERERQAGISAEKHWGMVRFFKRGSLIGTLRTAEAHNKPFRLMMLKSHLVPSLPKRNTTPRP